VGDTAPLSGTYKYTHSNTQVTYTLFTNTLLPPHTFQTYKPFPHTSCMQHFNTNARNNIGTQKYCFLVTMHLCCLLFKHCTPNSMTALCYSCGDHVLLNLSWRNSTRLKFCHEMAYSPWGIPQNSMLMTPDMYCLLTKLMVLGRSSSHKKWNIRWSLWQAQENYNLTTGCRKDLIPNYPLTNALTNPHSLVCQKDYLIL
jgi:hypothetical protein